MRIIPLLAAAALSLSIASVVTPAAAAPAVPNISTADASAVVQARHHGRHFRHHVWRGHGIYGHRWGAAAGTSAARGVTNAPIAGRDLAGAISAACAITAAKV